MIDFALRATEPRRRVAHLALDRRIAARRSRLSAPAAGSTPPDGLLRHSYTASAMPIYEYRCDNGHTFEVMQKMTDAPVTECETCGAPVQRVFHPVAVHFKGSGFYNTDYGKKKKSGASGSSDSGSDSGSGSGSGDSGSSDSSSSSSSSSDSGGSKSSDSSVQVGLHRARAPARTSFRPPPGREFGFFGLVPAGRGRSGAALTGSARMSNERPPVRGLALMALVVLIAGGCSPSPPARRTRPRNPSRSTGR